MAGTLKIINVEKLFFIGAALALKSLDDMLDSGVVNALVLRNPHLVFS